MALAREGRNVPFAFNRKEAKNHGESGDLVGAPLAGRVLIVDDVLTAGTAVRESFDIIEGAARSLRGVISLDRMERARGSVGGPGNRRAPRNSVIAIASLDDLMSWLEDRAEYRQNLDAIKEYRQLYGVAHHA